MEDYRGKKCLFLIFQTLEEGNGITKKILAQKRAFCNNGVNTKLCFYDKDNFGNIIVKVDETVLMTLGRGFVKLLKTPLYFCKLFEYIKDNKFDIIYIRYVQNADCFLVDFLKKCNQYGCIVLMEIPTYPYDGELKCRNLKSFIRIKIEKYFRVKFKNSVTRIVTFSNHKEIYGVGTINISNAVDEVLIPKNPIMPIKDKIVFIGVANLSFWHGYDRLINGLHNFYMGNPKIRVEFLIVGKGVEKVYNELRFLIDKYCLNQYVRFCGSKDGAELDELFYHAHVAIGCLACHRKNIEEVKSLKNVEYAMRGIPFIYSENNDDFDDKNYVYKVPADESDIDIEQICKFVLNHNFIPTEIRKTVQSLTWTNQMAKIMRDL